MLGIFKKRNKLAQKVAPACRSHTLSAEVYPDEVIELLNRRDQLNCSEPVINLLGLEASAKYSADLQGIDVARHLGLIALDDAEDSNPYCYIAGGVAAGMVVHFSHDPEPRIEFESLAAFEAHLWNLRATSRGAYDVDVPSPAHPHQAALAAELSELGSSADEELAESLICLYLPLLRGQHEQVLARLAAHDSFFVREAVAEAIGSGKLSGAGAIVRTLREDQNSQVRAAAVRAFDAG